MLNSTETRILECMQNGMTAADTALHVGVDASYISQISKTDTFQTQLSAKRVERLEKYTKRDDVWNQLEDKALGNLMQIVDGEFNSMKLLKIAQTANAAKRRGVEAADELNMINGQTRQIVTVLIPDLIKSRFVRNLDNEITEVNGRKLETVDPIVFVNTNDPTQKALENDTASNSGSTNAASIRQPKNTKVANVQLL